MICLLHRVKLAGATFPAQIWVEETPLSRAALELLELLGKRKYGEGSCWIAERQAENSLPNIGRVRTSP